MSRIPTRAFGREFTHIPEHVREDLDSLERESAVYTDHWIEAINDFRHVRIRFTADECAEYARRAWAFELFLRAGSPGWAREAPGIDQDVAAEADSYDLTLDGTVVSAPYHCFAAFLGEHLEKLTCTNERIEVIDLQGKEKLLFDVSRVIASLTPTIRSFNDRERALPPGRFSKKTMCAIYFTSCCGKLSSIYRRKRRCRRVPERTSLLTCAVMQLNLQLR
jgi:hypothetical protein